MMAPLRAPQLQGLQGLQGSSSIVLLLLLLFASLLQCAAVDSPAPSTEETPAPTEIVRVYLEPPPGIFTSDASFDAETREVIEDKKHEIFTIQELETAQPGFVNRLKAYDRPATEFHMKPVRAIHARAVADMPVYDNIYNRFISSLGIQDGGVKGFTAAMDSVTTASVEGALVYVQSEVINQFGRTVTSRCRRKSDIKFIVFYEMLIVQPNASLALFQDGDPATTIHEYGPFTSFDRGRCTPTSSPLGQDEFSDACCMINGNHGRPKAGAFVGAVRKSNEPRALYKDAYWFSFPHSCPMQPWGVKTPECRAETAPGLCPPGKKPDGVACTYTHNILGFLPLDDLVGITSIVNNATGQPFGNFSEFCRFGNVEFAAFEKFDFVMNSLPFWQYPLDAEANTRRTQQMIDTYNTLTGPVGSSSQIFFRLREKMKPLPTIDELNQSNPPCYENVEACVHAEYGCKRETYAQICRLCTTLERGCTKPPATFAFPKLTKPIGTRKRRENKEGKQVSPEKSEDPGQGGEEEEEEEEEDGSGTSSESRGTRYGEASRVLLLAATLLTALITRWL